MAGGGVVRLSGRPLAGGGVVRLSGRPLVGGGVVRSSGRPLVGVMAWAAPRPVRPVIGVRPLAVGPFGGLSDD
jgi:hypothetical protein